MIFQVDSKEMNSAVLSVIKALPIRTTMPSLEGIYIEAKGSTITLKCSDLMLQKECRIASEIDEEGAVIVPGKLFTEITRKLPEGRAQFSVSGKQVDIRCERFKTSIQALDFEEFPEMRFTGDSYDIEMDKEACKDLILETVFAVANDDSKPILTGVLLEVGESVTAVATDAYQFAMRKAAIKNPCPETSTVVPGKTMNEIARMLDEAGETIKMTFTRTHVKVDLGYTCLTARLLDGDYIKYKQIIPKDYKTRVLVNRQEIMNAIDRATLVAREGNNNIIMEFHDNKLTLHANSFIGTSNEDIDVQMNGDNIEIAFNPKYCMNVLKNVPDEQVYFDLTTNISPCVVRPVNGDAYYYLIVPVRIYSQY